MIKVGSRVVRGPDWKFTDQDAKSLGTVIANNTEEGDKHTWWLVKWDKSEYPNSYRSQYGFYEVLDKESDTYCNCGGPGKITGFGTLVFTVCAICKKEKRQ